MGAVRMRNPKPAAKESRLYDHASTAISGGKELFERFGRGSREVRISKNHDRATEQPGHSAVGCQSRKDRHAIEEFEEIVFEKLFTSSPNPRRNEP